MDYLKMEDIIENPSISFCQLPVEVRVGIFEILPYKDLLTMRLVSRQIKKEVDEHMDVHVKYDQLSKSKGILRRRIKSCHIVYFTRTYRFPKIFHHPKRVKKLTFDGLISQLNLVRILNQCRSVEHLVFTHETLGIPDLLQSKYKFDSCIQNLTSLTHLNLQLLRYPLGDPFEMEDNIEVFLRATFPSLQSFRLYFSLWGNFESLVKFLERHTNTLKELELQVGDRGDARNTEKYLRTNPMRVDESQRKNLLSLNLTKFRFRDDVLNLNSIAKDLIICILLNQRHLQVVQFYSPGELSWSTLRSIVTQNEKTLKEVVVYNVQTNIVNGVNQLGAQVPELFMDMSMFSKCPCLQTLALSCSSSNGNDPNVVGNIVMKMSNLQNISESIERLHLTGFTLDGQELVCLSNKARDRLKEVLIADAGSMRYSDVLISFLKNCHNLSYLNFRPVLLQAANEQMWWKEVEKLSKLYERFMGITYDPIDDLEGFEANIKDSDKEWLSSYAPSLSLYSNNLSTT